MRYVKDEATHQAIAAGATALAAAATGGTSVAAQAVAVAATRSAQKHTPRPTKSPDSH